MPGSKTGTSRSRPTASSWEGAHYTSASLTTRDRFAFVYGKIEIRARVPGGRGTWPALWMLGAGYPRVPWPLCGEIDLMEHVGFDPNRLHFTVHTAAYNHNQRTHRGTSIVVPDATAQFHRYGLIWTPERLEWFFNGEKVFEFANEGTGPEVWPFDAPHFLLINLAIGGAWGGQQGIDETVFPARFRVDYVRVWQRAPAPDRVQTSGIRSPVGDR
jgi:Beta-glucanase/Beta-glucan synthetase